MENERIVRKVVKVGQKPTEEQLMEIEVSSKMPISYDEDCPELTLEQYAEMARIARSRRANQNKTVVAIRVTPKTLEKAKAVGKGYTGFLSRLLDNAINDPVLVEKSL